MHIKQFMNAIPVGSVTRRDGVLNIAAHVAVNSNPPDIGPKGYFSEACDPNGSGTTKLHSKDNPSCYPFVDINSLSHRQWMLPMLLMS
jgi:hypothetical protein